MITPIAPPRTFETLLSEELEEYLLEIKNEPDLTLVQIRDEVLQRINEQIRRQNIDRRSQGANPIKLGYEKSGSDACLGDIQHD